MTKKNRISKSLEDRLRKVKTGVIKFKPITLDGERFMPYCNYSWHEGICKDYVICEERMCSHYKRLYIE